MWRKIKTSRILLSGLVFRLIVIIAQIGFFWLITGSLVFASWTAVAWNAVNIGIYYAYHIPVAKLFKLGSGKCSDCGKKT